LLTGAGAGAGAGADDDDVDDDVVVELPWLPVLIGAGALLSVKLIFKGNFFLYNQ
jgi:hypothetical protein